ncbi:DUF2225 domain-containing protein [Ammonifex thiophilus]|uniref:DUF2225 domain-containing protein n=1 Tax=Ammonifex thiophilus TaxID=444093 RepID=A0A3D8P4H5_9THEO|nr:DUF2225 domain-containing protein [Ammonifex thiophilus]RDV82116.1 DUF2225 domain-containing protein [Ammonifex thiophilus]
MKQSEQLTSILRRVPPLHVLSGTFLSTLAGHVKVVAARKGEGLPVEEGIVVLQGRVMVTGRGRTEVGGPGTILGILSLLGVEEDVAARALDEAVVLIIGRENFRALLLSRPEEGVSLLYYLAEELQRQGGSFNRIVPPPAEEKGAPLEAVPEAAPGKEEPFYHKSFTCPFCRSNFTSVVLKSRFLRVERMDTDFCPHYAGELNALFYEAVVCPYCGFAFTEEVAEVPARFRPQVENCLKGLGNEGKDFWGRRDWDTALTAFLRVASCAAAAGVRKSLLGKVYLKIAWLYRLAGKEEEEKEYLEKARGHLRAAFEEERLGGPEAELNLLYLLGELSFRLGDRAEAARWWSLILHHPHKEAQPRILQRTRERWYELRREGEREIGKEDG